MKLFNFLNTILIANLFLLTNVNAQNFSSNKHNTTITSNIIDIKQKSQTIHFINNVVIKNGPDIMTSQEVILFYKKNKKTGKNKIKNINAYKDVKIFASNFVATSEIGYYNPNKSIFVLEEDVIVNNGNSIGVGDKFIYNLITKQGEFATAKRSKLKSKTDNRATITIDSKKRTKGK